MRTARPPFLSRAHISLRREQALGNPFDWLDGACGDAVEGRVVGARDAAQVRIEARGEAMVVVEGRAPPRSNDTMKYRVGLRGVGAHWITKQRRVVCIVDANSCIHVYVRQ